MGYSCISGLRNRKRAGYILTKDRVMSGEDRNLNENERLQTLGEYRIGLNFNPSGNDDVNTIKILTATLIDTLDSLALKGTEANRCAALAKTNYELAAMWAVKAVTKKRKREIVELVDVEFIQKADGSTEIR